MMYALHLCVMLGLYGILALAANLVVGYGGLISLATAMFYGLGAYLHAILTVNAGWPFLAALPTAIAASALIGGLSACLLLRFRGETFTVSTMAMQTIAFALFYNWTDLTGGPYGFPDIPRPEIFGAGFDSPAAFCALTLGLAAAAIAAITLFSKTRCALSLRALRDDESAAKTLGVAPWRIFAIAFVSMAMLAAMSGALFAAYVAYVDPTGFTISESVLVLAMLIVGGSGNIKGPLTGALLLTLLPEALRFANLSADIAAPLREIAYGILLVVFMYLKPRGIAGDYAIR